MFSGIVETIGILCGLRWHEDCLVLTILPKIMFQDIMVGDSIAVNGVCLTVTALFENTMEFHVVPETLRLTCFSELVLNSEVNLERSLEANARIGGHYVQGHVDGIGEIIALQQDGKGALLVTMTVPSTMTKYIVKKGYITIDGMSITVVDVKDDKVTVTFIPHTQQVTCVKHYQIGSKINIEVDILGKYVEKFLEASKP
ncbi:hypothetical protein AYO45_02135 [Gammaproteobacteria bacterium SCGC AG-212-F23]|nr:hypothetical protein AYO45_02135 [Gammaproteobacteria bacterium SCGC AG-212-F23]